MIHAQKGELKESIKSHELKFQREHSKLPGQQEDESFAKLYKKLKYVKWLLTSWDIRLWPTNALTLVHKLTFLCMYHSMVSSLYIYISLQKVI